MSGKLGEQAGASDRSPSAEGHEHEHAGAHEVATPSGRPPGARFELFTDTFWISPWVFTCFVALHEKALPFQTSTIALERREQRAEGYRRRTVTGRVPALRDGTFWLAESTAIVDYLEEAYPETPRVLPADVIERARARQILSWLRSDLGALREARPTTTMFYTPVPGPLPHAAREAADKLLAVADALVPEGATSIFGAWTIADSDLAFTLQRLIRNGEQVPERLAAYAAAQWARPSVRAFVERERPAYVSYD
jgi:glutathione S-transferase